MQLVKDNLISILVALALLIGGISCTIIQNDISLEVEQIRTFGQDSQIHTVNKISQPTSYFTLEIIGRICYSIMTAILIAIFITGQINARKEKDIQIQREQIKHDVFESLFEMIIDKELFKAVKSDLIQHQVVVKEAKWDFDFRTKDGDTEHIYMRLTIRYKIQNTSKKTISEPLKFLSIDAPSFDTSLISAQCSKSDGALLFQYPNEVAANTPKVEFNPVGATAQEVILPLEISGGKYVNLVLVFESTYRGDFQDTYYIKHPTIDGEISIKYPDHLEASIVSSTSAAVREIPSGINRKTYMLEGAILPRQGFTYVLSRKQIAPTQSIAVPKAVAGEVNPQQPLQELQ